VVRPSVSRFRTVVVVAVLLTAPASAADLLEGRAVPIADGDTITVLVGGKTHVKVRLAEFDAPEKTQPFDERSRQNLASVTFGRAVEIRWHKKDRFLGEVDNAQT